MVAMPLPDRQLKLIPLRVDQIRTEWGFIVEHLKRILRKTKEAWLPEDVYTSLIQGQSACLIVYDNNERVGALVVRKDQEEWTTTQYLFVWCVSLKNTDFDLALAELRKFAEAIGVKSIRGESPRMGWSKRAKMLSAVYEFEVNQ